MLAKKITHFTIQFRLKKITHFTNPLKMMCSQNKAFPLYKFCSKRNAAWCQKKHLNCSTLWCERTAYWKHFESKCVCISVYLLEKIIVPKTQDFIWCDEGCGNKLNNFLKAAHCLGLIKCCTIFHFNWTFWNFSYVSAFRYLHL